MKRILFVCNNLDHGGIPKALVNLLREIHGDYAVDLLLFYPWGPYLKDVPSDVRLLPSEGLLPLLGIPQSELQKKSKKGALLRGFFVLWSRLFGNAFPRRCVFSTVPALSGYDTAVAFAQDNSSRAFAIGCNAFVLNKVEASQKATFVHCDFEHYGGNTRGNRRIYRKFDRIACVSRGCRDAFLRVLPDLADRTQIVYNCTDYGLIRRLRFFFCPLPALGKPGSRIIALVCPHGCQHFTGKIRAFAAVISAFGFAAGFHPALSSPKGLFHVPASLAMYLFPSLTLSAQNSASRFIHHSILLFPFVFRLKIRDPFGESPGQPELLI